MTTDRQHLLTRCLRLEAEVLRLRAGGPRPARRYVTPEDRATICALRIQGKRVRAIAAATGWSANTVYSVLAQQM